jgi:predicted ATP-grasp superfamily ATP-dependent carboligase
MSNFIVVGKSNFVVIAVLQAIRSYTDAKVTLIGDHETNALRWSTLCARKLTIQFNGSDDEKFIGMVNTAAKKMPHLKLIPVDCEGIRITNRVLDRLSVNVTPIPNSPTLEMFDDKWQFHQFCTQHALQVPTTRFIGTKHDLDFDAVAADLGLPFVIKPTNQAGSLGVLIVSSKTFFGKKILNNPDYKFCPLIAQRFVDGVDIDLSLLAINGRLSAFAIQQTNGFTTGFVSNSYLEKVAAKISSDSAYHGVMHIDARIEKRTGQVFLIEANPRFWASLTAAVWCGLNFVAESAEQTPRVKGVRSLTHGTFHTRHPAIRPASWRRLIVDSGQCGRLLRANMFDPYSLSNFAVDLPTMFWRYAKKRTVALAKYRSYEKA